MKKRYHIVLVLVLVLVTMTFSFGANANWLGMIGISLMIYYFTFLLNLFRKMYERENFLTKVFFSFSKMPMYLSTIMIVTISILERNQPQLNFKAAYVSVVIGFVVGIVAMLKKKNVTA